jgi:hypothetical protein
MKQCASPSKAVILRESGVSSTPQLLDSIIDSLEYWITAFADDDG